MRKIIKTAMLNDETAEMVQYKQDEQSDKPEDETEEEIEDTEEIEKVMDIDPDLDLKNIIALINSKRDL